MQMLQAKSRCTVSFTRDLFKLFFFFLLRISFCLWENSLCAIVKPNEWFVRLKNRAGWQLFSDGATNIRAGICIHDNIGRITRGNNNNRILAIEKRADKSHHTQKQDKLLPNPPSGEFAKTKRDFMYRFSISSSLRKISHGNVPGKRYYILRVKVSTLRVLSTKILSEWRSFDSFIFCPPFFGYCRLHIRNWKGFGTVSLSVYQKKEK